MNKLKISITLILLIFNIINCQERLRIENHFYKYENDFMEYINSKIDNRKFNGVKRWIYAYKWENQNNLIIDFIIGKDYKTACYKPKIVYIESDNYMDCPHCKGDGEIIKRIKRNWFICKAEQW